MKKNLNIALLVLLVAFLTSNASAQSAEQRNKMQMTVTYGGKTITTELNSMSTSLSRYEPEVVSAASVVAAAADTSKVKIKAPVSNIPTFYLTLELKQISPELLNLMSKRTTRFDGTVTIVDTYGKYPNKVIKFKQAALYTYSDQFSAAPYNDGYSSAVISVSCKELSIDGVVLEQ